MITLNSISHSVADHSLFHQLTISLSAKKYGLVGPNGAGKTTLAKIMAGRLIPDEGRVLAQGTVVYVSQIEVPAEDTTVAQYLLGIWESPNHSADIMAALLAKLDWSRLLTQLSGGEWMRVRLALALSQSPALLILDEPSNNLDRAGREVVLQFLEAYRGALLVISHDREILARLETMLELSNQGLTIYGGNFEFYEEQRSMERQLQSENLEQAKRAAKKREAERLQKLGRQEKRMREGEKGAPDSGLPKILIGARKRRAQVSMGKIVNRETAYVDEAQSSAQNAFDLMKSDPFLRLNFLAAEVPSGKVLVEVKDFNWVFPQSTKPLWARPIDLQIRGPQRWHLAGANGSGKSTLLKCLMQFVVPGRADGQLEVRTDLIGYLDQRNGTLNGEESLLLNLQHRTRFSETELRNELAFYGFTGGSVFQNVNTLSGGEMMRACLAQIFLGAKIPELIVLDEPTNNLDLQSLELLERTLRDFRGALVIVSHDDAFVKNLKITDRLDLNPPT